MAEEKKRLQLYENCQQVINFENLAEKLPTIIGAINNSISDISLNSALIVRLRDNNYSVDKPKIKKLHNQELIKDIIINIKKGSSITAHITFHVVHPETFLKPRESVYGAYHIKSEDNMFSNAIGVTKEGKLTISELTISSQYSPFNSSSNEISIARQICYLINQDSSIKNKKGGGNDSYIFIITINFSIDNGTEIYYYNLIYNLDLLNTSDLFLDILNNTQNEKKINIADLKLSEENLLIVLIILYIYASYVKNIYEQEKSSYKSELYKTELLPLNIKNQPISIESFGGYYKKYLKYKRKYLEIKKLKK